MRRMFYNLSSILAARWRFDNPLLWNSGPKCIASEGRKKGAGTGEGVRESHCEKGIRVHRRREIRWTRMRTLLCPERAYTVGTLMSARIKAWALLCLLLAKLPQQVACSAGSPVPFQDYRSKFLSIFPFPLFSSRVSRESRRNIYKIMKEF